MTTFLTPSEAKSFFARLEATPMGCVEWMGARLKPKHGAMTGYGQFYRRGRRLRAHRVMYALSQDINLEEVPDLLDHRCNNPACVLHVEPSDHCENALRGNVSKRAGCVQRAKTHCPHGHEYTFENTYTTRAGHRMCRACLKIRDRVRYLKKKVLVEE